jgi:GGDEF domain-containing protein
MRNALATIHTLRSRPDAPPLREAELLPGVGDRSNLIADLTEALKPLQRDSVFVMFRLGGLERYQSVLGARLANAVVSRVATVLQDIVDTSGSCYHTGRDRFAALVNGPTVEARGLVAAAAQALRTEGEPYLISASCGVVLVPSEAATPSQALELADRRLRAEIAWSRLNRGVLVAR